jgi:hypothetical protein
MKHFIPRPDKHDPEALDQALADLIEAAGVTRDCFLTGNSDGGKAELALAITALAKAVHQISLK